MNKYTYRVVCYIDVIADNEEDAQEMVETQFPVEPDVIDLYETEEISKEEGWLNL